MIIRPVETKDVGNFFRMLCLLDEETEYMMYEPGERRAKTPDLKRLTASVEATASEADLLLAAENETGKIRLYRKDGYFYGVYRFDPRKNLYVPEKMFFCDCKEK